MKTKAFKREKKRMRMKKRFSLRKYIKKKYKACRTFFRELPRRFARSDIRDYLTLNIIAFSLFLTFKRYRGSFDRVLDTIYDSLTSFVHYIFFIVKANKPSAELPAVNATVTEIPDVDLQEYIPFDLDDLVRKFRIFGNSLFDSYIFVDYNQMILEFLRKFVPAASLLFMALLIFFYVAKDSLLKPNDKPLGSYSRQFGAFCKVLKFLKVPFEKAKDYFKRIYDQTRVRKLIFGIWLVNLNVVSVCLSVLAWYFYFISSFDLKSFGTELVRLLYDVIIMLSGLPFFLWLVIFFAIYILWALNWGYKELAHMEAKNCGFLKTTDYIVCWYGGPGTGKTSHVVHSALEWHNIQHRDALDKMFKMEMLFPAFPFSAFRKIVNDAISCRQITCPPECDLLIDELEDVYNRTPSPSILFGYDADLFAYDRDTGVALINIFDAMRIYARAYYIYSNDNLIVSALPIRLDGYFKFLGHLEKWYGEFFKRSMREVKKIKKYSHILDEDVWRLGKHMDEDNPRIGSFGPGIWVKPEIGKSHGNQNETEGQRKDDEECNEKNDMFHWMMKMIRHVCSTVDNTVFMRVITDEQRPMDLPANVRQILSVVDIGERSDLLLALPYDLTVVIDWLYDKVYVPFVKFYEDYSYNRSDMILSVMLCKLAVSALSNMYEWLYNTFGYYEEQLTLEKGSTFGESGSVVKTHTYYFFVKLGYSERFSTDSHNQWFAKAQMAARVGLRDYPEYKDITMSPEEMDEQHDFFIEKMKAADRAYDLQEERDAERKNKKYSYGSGRKKPKKEEKSESDIEYQTF